MWGYGAADASVDLLSVPMDQHILQPTITKHSFKSDVGYNNNEGSDLRMIKNAFAELMMMKKIK